MWPVVLLALLCTSAPIGAEYRDIVDECGEVQPVLVFRDADECEKAAKSFIEQNKPWPSIAFCDHGHFSGEAND